MTEQKEPIVYSWSRINSFALAEKEEGCFWNYYVQYIEGDRGIGNYFSDYGTLLHETIEKIHNNELFEWDYESEIKNGLRNLKFKAPFPPMGKSYEKAMYEFFCNSDFGEMFKDYKMIEAEEEFRINIDGIHIKGFPDMIADHSKHGLVVVDYKSSKVYEDDKLTHNLMQLYVYAIAVFDKYGKYPDHLIYWFPRMEAGNREHVYPFKMEDLERTKQFIKDTVAKIIVHDNWIPRCTLVDGRKDFFANMLCGGRKTCKHKDYFSNQAKKKKVVGENPFNEDDDYDPFKD
jgi:hypothetical protein